MFVYKGGLTTDATLHSTVNCLSDPVPISLPFPSVHLCDINPELREVKGVACGQINAYLLLKTVKK